MNTAIKSAKPVNMTHYFGACPLCGESDGYMNIGQSHWFVCDNHKTRWEAGANLFSSWMQEDSADWERNAEILFGYDEVDPLPVEDEEEFSR